MASKHSITTSIVEISEDLKEVIAVFKGRRWPDRGADIDRLAFHELIDRGFTGQLRGGQPYLDTYGRDHDGWINIVVSRHSGPIAIEVDNDNPRVKSIKKLRLFKGERLIVVRRGKSFRPHQVRGIHRVISVGVVPAAKQSDDAEIAVCLHEKSIVS